MIEWAERRRIVSDS